MSSQETDDLEEGDVVEFTDPHHAMNSSLKRMEGCQGTVTSVPDPESHNLKVLVEFEENRTSKQIERWWIKPERLTKLEGEDD